MMTNNGQPLSPPDLSEYEENRRRFPLEQLLPYAGLFVAWSADGSRILVSAETREELYKKLQSAGIHFSQVVFDYIDPPEVALF